MASLQAQALAAQGFCVLLLDLFGTGDSDGEFGEARWEIWLDDIRAAADWLEAISRTRISLWGLRSGALLAAQAASRHPERFRSLLLWQPVSDGKMLMTQFLRIRIAAALGERTSETTENLRSVLVSGMPIEVAGYELAPDLVATIDQLKLSSIDLPPEIEVIWLEISRAVGDPLLPASQRVVDTWRQRGLNVQAETAPGIPFWNIQEMATAPALIDASIRLLLNRDPKLPSPR